MLDGLIRIALEARTEKAAKALAAALPALARETPALRYDLDQESGQLVLSGDDEEQLDGWIARLKAVADINVGAPEVAYRETFSRSIIVTHMHKRRVQQRGEFAVVKLWVGPGGPGSGVVFENEDRSIGSYLPGVRKGVDAVAKAGLLAGLPVIDFKVILIDSSQHDVDSNLVSFDIATRSALAKAREAVVLAEPWMTLEVVFAAKDEAKIAADLGQRRGLIKRRETGVIEAEAPLAGLLGYGAFLRTLADDKAAWTRRFSHYAPVPRLSSPDPAFPPAIGMRA